MNTVIILIINVKHDLGCKVAYLYQLQSTEDGLIPAKSRGSHFSGSDNYHYQVLKFTIFEAVTPLPLFTSTVGAYPHKKRKPYFYSLTMVGLFVNLR